MSEDEVCYICGGTGEVLDEVHDTESLNDELVISYMEQFNVVLRKCEHCSNEDIERAIETGDKNE